MKQSEMTFKIGIDETQRAMLQHALQRLITSPEAMLPDDRKCALGMYEMFRDLISDEYENPNAVHMMY